MKVVGVGLSGGRRIRCEFRNIDGCDMSVWSLSRADRFKVVLGIANDAKVI
jgi:hypothetical protein